MKPFMMGAAAALIGCTAANAADLPMKALPPAPPMYPPYSWTGFYIGGNLGGAWANGSVTDDITGFDFNTSHSGFIWGGQVGFNYQVTNIVFGVEANFDWSSLTATSTAIFVPAIPAVLQASGDTRWLATIAGRLGIAYDRWLFYAKGGGGWVGNTASVTDLTTG